MRKISYSLEVHAALDTVWNLLIEKVEQPQTYMPGVIQSRILQHYGNGVLRCTTFCWSIRSLPGGW